MIYTDPKEKTMSEKEFIEYASYALSEGLESLYEIISEHNGEVAMFGDSGPGRLLHINSMIQDVVGVERQLARIQKREPRKFHFSVSLPR